MLSQRLSAIWHFRRVLQEKAKRTRKIQRFTDVDRDSVRHQHSLDVPASAPCSETLQPNHRLAARVGAAMRTTSDTCPSRVLVCLNMAAFPARFAMGERRPRSMSLSRRTTRKAGGSRRTHSRGAIRMQRLSFSVSPKDRPRLELWRRRRTTTLLTREAAWPSAKSSPTSV